MEKKQPLVPRRNTLKLVAITGAAAYLNACNRIIQSPSSQIELKGTVSPFDLKNTIYLDGIPIHPNEINSSGLDEFARKQLTLLHEMIPGNNSVINIYTIPVDKANPEGPRRTLAVEIRQPRTKDNDFMIIVIQDGSENGFRYQFANTVEADPDGDYGDTKTYHLDVNTHSMYCTRNNHIKTLSLIKENLVEKIDLFHIDDPVVEDKLYNEQFPERNPDERSEENSSSLELTIKRLQNLGGKNGRLFHLTKMDIESNGNSTEPVITIGSLGFHRIMRLARLMTAHVSSKDEQENAESFIKYFTSVMTNSIPKEINTIDGYQTSLNQTLELLDPSVKSKWEEKGYQHYFIDSGQFSQQDLDTAFHYLKLLVSKYNKEGYVKKLTSSQLGELVELLLYKKYFVPDVNPSKEVFDASIISSILPDELVDKGGMFFDPEVAGAITTFDQNQIIRFYNDTLETKIKELDHEKLTDEQKKSKKTEYQTVYDAEVNQIQRVFKRFNANSNEEFKVSKYPPRLVGFTEVITHSDGKKSFRYKIVEYNFDGNPAKTVFEMDTDDPALQSRLPSDAATLYIDPVNNIPYKYYDVTKAFQCKKEQFEPADLEQIGLENEYVDLSEDHIKVTLIRPVILEPEYFYTRPTDFNNKHVVKMGLPYLAQFDEKGILNTKILFLEDNGVKKFFANNEVVDPYDYEVMTRVTQLIEIARRLNRQIFSRNMFAGIGELAKLIAEGPVYYIDENADPTRQLKCQSIAELIPSNPNKFDDEFLERMFPRFKSLAYIGGDTPVFTAEQVSLIEKFTTKTYPLNTIKNPRIIPNNVLQPGGYLVIDNFAFINGVPFGHIAKNNDTEGLGDFYVPLNNLFFEKSDTIAQEAIFYTAMVAVIYGFGKTSVGASLGKFMMKQLIKTIEKSAGLVTLLE